MKEMKLKEIKSMIVNSNEELFEKGLRVTMYRKKINIFYWYDKVIIDLSELHNLISLIESFKWSKVKFFEELSFTFKK